MHRRSRFARPPNGTPPHWSVLNALTASRHRQLTLAARVNLRRRKHAMNKKLMTIGVTAALVVQAVFLASAGAAGRIAPRGVDGPSSGLVDALQPRASRVNAVRRGATGLPTWTGSFQSAGKTYGYTMVGSDPSAGSATTRVPVRL